MLDDFDKTLEKLLFKEIPRDKVDIAFDQPTSEWSARLNRPTLNCWCFDLRENLRLRSLEASVMKQDMRATTKYAPRRIDLTYLVTAWAREVEDEHQLLWWALATLKRFISLEPEECEGALRYQTHRVPLLIADVSDFPVNLVDLWSVLDNQMRLGFTLTATVELDTQLEFTSTIVQKARLRFGQSESPADRKLPSDNQIDEITHRPKNGEEGAETNHKQKK